MSLCIGILGTRGIPNRYGGFEQFAAHLSEAFILRGHDVSVYSSHKHFYQEKIWNGVHIIHCYDPEYIIGTAGQFMYDLNCVMDARKRKFDIILVLGYTSSSVWGKWYPKNSIIITNMDGLEWKRSKYAAPVQRFLRYAEKLAVKFSDHHIADSIPVQDYLQQKYSIQPVYISYGAEVKTTVNDDVLAKYGVEMHDYFLLIARMEPENNIEMILDALAVQQRTILVIGGTGNKYGKKMVSKYRHVQAIHFLGTVFDKPVLDTLRAGCLLYFHGHSVGGTNPSLLEAMANGAMVCAHDNVFNRAVLGDEAYYFFSRQDIIAIVAGITEKNRCQKMIGQNLQKIKERHSWEKIINEYENLFIQCYQTKK